MKTYTFKIKVDSDKVVIAVNMQLEQFFDSIKLTNFKELCERYPFAYVTATDYYYDLGEEKIFVKDDYVISSLKNLIDCKNLKQFLTSSNFFGFYGDEDGYNLDGALSLQEKAHDYILSCEDIEDNNDEQEEKEDELSETNKE